MTFATPLIAGIIAAIAIPSLIILYFLKLRRKPMDVSTTLLWKKSIMDIQANAPFQKLRRNILLLLQLLVLLLLIAALAQPRTEQVSAGGQRVVVMLDRSASMGSTDAEPGRDDITRLEEAKRRAIELVGSLREPGLLDRTQADEAMVVAFDAAAEIIQPFTTDKHALIDAIRSVKVTDAPTSIEEAYRLSQAQRPNRQFNDNAGGTTEGTPIEIEGLKGGPAYTYHLFSDGRIPDAAVFKPDPDQADQPTFEYHRVGDPQANNMGIVALRAERAFDNPNRLSVFVGIQGTETAPRSVDVELLIDDRLASVRAVTIPAAEPASPGSEAGLARPGTGGVVFELNEPNAVRVTVRLAGVANTPGNALAADDAGVLIVPPAKRSAVALVGPGSLFLSEALRGLPLSRFETLTPAQYETERASGALARFDVIVFDRYLPERRANADANTPTLDPGRYLVFGAVVAPPQGVEDLGEAGATTIIDWRRNHPVLRNLTLDGLVMGKSRPVRIPKDSGVVPLAEIPAGPTIVEISDGTVRAIVASFDLAQTNWPFQVGFVVYLASAIDYLSGSVAAEDASGTRQIVPGGVLSDRLPAGASSVRVFPPSGGSQELVPALDGTVVYGPIRERGVYRVQWTGPAGENDTTESGGRVSRYYASNLLNAPESDIRPVEELGLADRLVRAKASTDGGLLELWPFVVLGALLIMMLEWWVYNKRVSL